MSSNRPPSGSFPNRKIEHLLAADHPHRSVLRNLLNQAEMQVSWTRALRAVLPDGIRQDCRVIAVQGTVLVIGCRTAAAATRLRFIGPEILSDLGQLSDFSGVSSLKIQVLST